jgi:hypothetical protein
VAATLAACGASEDAQQSVDPLDLATAQDDNRLDCAIGGAEWAHACGVERLEGPAGLTLTIRHPDGGFRRLLVTKDGRGVVPADGAETASVRIIDAGRIEVTVAGDRYRLPATVKS